MDIRQNLSAKIRTLRSLKRISLEEFAAELGIGKTTLQEIESCKSNFTAETINIIARSLETPPSALLSEDLSPREFYTATLLLRGLECFNRLSAEERREAARLFDSLTRLLSTERGGCGLD